MPWENNPPLYALIDLDGFGHPEMLRVEITFLRSWLEATPVELMENPLFQQRPNRRPNPRPNKKAPRPNLNGKDFENPQDSLLESPVLPSAPRSIRALRLMDNNGAPPKEAFSDESDGKSIKQTRGNRWKYKDIRSEQKQSNFHVGQSPTFNDVILSTKCCQLYQPCTFVMLSNLTLSQVENIKQKKYRLS